jgi:cytochrome c1
MQQKGCGGCHTIPGVPGATGAIGPNLSGVASRPTIAAGAVPNSGPDNLKRWILDPPAVKPGTAMPKLGLTDDEATTIVAFLETLR